jgi:anti-anti-sigma factor
VEPTERSSTAGIFGVELDGETVLVTPVRTLRELDFQEIEAGATVVLAFLNRMPARNVVVDLCRMDYSGSTALGFFIRLSKAVKDRGGRMALCNVSPREKEVLKGVHLDEMWCTYDSRQRALEAVRGHPDRALGHDPG